MQQWLDNSIPESNTSSHIAAYNSPASDVLSEASNFYRSPDVVTNHECGRDEGPAVFLQQSDIDRALQSVNLADMLLIPSTVAAESVTDYQHLDSTQNPAYQLPGGQLK